MCDLSVLFSSAKNYYNTKTVFNWNLTGYLLQYYMHHIL